MLALEIAMGLSALTVVLLSILTVSWVQTYRDVPTPLALGLVGFCLVLLVENVVALYFYLFSMEMLYAGDPEIATLVALMRGLEFLAVAVFTYVTVR